MTATSDCENVCNDDLTFILYSHFFSGECYGTDYHLASLSYYYDANGNYYYNIGTLEICVNGTYYPSCLDSLPENICSSNLYYSNSGKLKGVASSHKTENKFSFKKCGAVDNKEIFITKKEKVHIC